MNMENLNADICQLKEDVVKIQVDLLWIKRLGTFITIAIVGQFLIKLFAS